MEMFLRGASWVVAAAAQGLVTASILLCSGYLVLRQMRQERLRDQERKDRDRD